jgi:hypothetical protein
MKKNTLVVLVILNTLYSYCCYGQANKNYSNVEKKNVLYYKVEEIVKMTFGGTTTRYTVSDLSLVSKVDLGPDNIRIITPVYRNENSTKKSYYVETRNLKKDSEKNQEETNLVEITIENKNIQVPENSQVEKVSIALAIDNLTKQEERRDSNKKSYSVKSDDLNRDLEKNKNLIDLVEVKNNTKKDKIHYSPKTDQFSLVINNLKKQEKGELVEDTKHTAEIQKTDKKSEKQPILVSLVKVKKETKKPALPEVTKQEKELLLIDSITKVENEPVATVQAESQEKNYVSINVTDVYERVAQKGYKSVYMFKEMANGYYFKNQMEKAVKWYGELFTMTNDLEPMYYYRFGIALIKTGEEKKGNAMIEKFNKMVE